MEIDMNIDVHKFCVSDDLSCGWIWIERSGSDLEFSFYTWKYTFLTKKKNVVLLNGNRNLKIKFEFKIRNSIETKTKI